MTSLKCKNYQKYQNTHSLAVAHWRNKKREGNQTMRVDSRRYFVMVRSLMTMLSMFILLAFMHGISSSFTPLPPRWNAFPSRLIPQFNSDGLVLLPADSILTPNVLFNCHNEATKLARKHKKQYERRKAKGQNRVQEFFLWDLNIERATQKSMLLYFMIVMMKRWIIAWRKPNRIFHPKTYREKEKKKFIDK